MSEARKKLAIIDGKSVFYRGYYAMPNLSTKDGTPTGGVYGFAVMALEVIKRLKPDYVCVAWDKPKTNIRKRLQMYPEYKAGRKPPPPDFYEQIPVLHTLLQAFGWPLYELDDYEADDIMGTLAVQAKEKDIETQLITSDLDALQLINGHVHVYALKKGLSNIELFRPETFILKYGITPDQFLDLKALKGDSSDNIPGVPGVGEKTALELLKSYKTLDEVYENIDLIKESVRTKLMVGKDSAYLSKKLAAIWTDAPVKLNLKEVDGSTCDPLRLQSLLEKLEFRTLARQLPEIMRVPVPAVSSQPSAYNHKTGGYIQFIDSSQKLARLDLKGTKIVIVHSKCANKQGKGPQLLILSPSSRHTYVIDLIKCERTDLSQIFNALFRSIKLVGYDIKSTLKMFIELGVQLPVVTHDVLIGSFLLNPLSRGQLLTGLAQDALGYQGLPFENSSDQLLTGRASELTEVIRALYTRQTKELSKLPKVARLAKNIEWPIISVLARMEYEGIQLDTKYLEVMSVQVDDVISDLEQQIYGHADHEFNINSPAQLADVLFNKLNLSTTGIKKGKTSYSTAASELDKLRGVHPVIDLISHYREVTKLKNTYIDALPKLVDDNSRLHTTFNLTIAQTGRLSSTDPNLQNIPVRTELGKKIRTAFVAGKGNMLVSADYSQFELRLAAYLSGDRELIGQFNEGVDVHTITAAQIYDRELEDVSKNMRRDAKVVNFGVMYGLSPHGLTVATGMTYEQAKHFIEKYFEVRPKLLKYIESVKEQARNKGFVETLFGRRRPTPDVHSSNFAVREAAMRAAVNMPFQGTAADIMKMAMIGVDQKLVKTNCSMLLQIHDSILIECPEKEADSTAKLLKDTMENVMKLPVKLTVDTAIGENWGEL